MKKDVKELLEEKKDVTLADFFKLVDEVAKKAKTDPSSQKLIDSAAQKWQSDSRYAN
jgi:vacuolar-type H+-ATPase subunit D/Vma8